MKPTLAVFIHDPQCETECALGMIEGLVRDFNIRTFGIDELNIEFLKTVDAVAFPGGMGDADDFYDIFTEDHIDAIHTFIGVYNGKYFGICMGAYWAGTDYFDIAVDLTIEQYIEQVGSEIPFDGPTVADVTWDGSLGKVLGTRGLMPNPKTGTVTTDVTKAVNDIKGGKIEFRIDKNSNLHFIIGKSSFTAAQLADNYAAALDEVHRAKPNSSKGRYIAKAVVSTTMGPGIQVDPNLVREPSAN